LRRQRELIERHKPRRFINAPLDVVPGLQRTVF